MNALRHGITGQVATMTDEDRAAHDAFSKALMQNLAPDGAMEVQLAQRIATDGWRLNRISAVEDRPLRPRRTPAWRSNLPGCPSARRLPSPWRTFFTEQSKQLQLLSLYEQRINRAIQKILALLHSLQAPRNAEREAAMKEAAALLKLSEMERLGNTSRPATALYFSNAQIHAAIDRDQRLQRASTTDFSKYRARTFRSQAA